MSMKQFDVRGAAPAALGGHSFRVGYIAAPTDAIGYAERQAGAGLYLINSVMKRSIDAFGAMVGLVLVGPVMILIAVAIRLESKGPVLFHQERLGLGGVPFWMTKFRTMVSDAEQRIGELEHLNESSGGVLFKLKQDPRTTPFGRFLRRTSLDELPQLFNILAGHMSLVGPRPLPLRDSNLLREQDERGFAERLTVLPGLTGPWQVGGRSQVGAEHMLRLDLDYVANWSPWLDLRIIAKTCVVLLLGRGAY
jgi:lipopolysaccharide/colanic/teichoic acid biosynthesis glycosyltransferase